MVGQHGFHRNVSLWAAIRSSPLASRAAAVKPGADACSLRPLRSRTSARSDAMGARPLHSCAVRGRATDSTGQTRGIPAGRFNQLHRGRGKWSDDCRTNPYAKAFGLPCVPARADGARRGVRRAGRAGADGSVRQPPHHPTRSGRPPSGAEPQICACDDRRWPISQHGR
jgi:hypothetical protein